jgi:Zn-dependent protease
MWILQALRDGDFLSLIMGLAVYALIIFVILPVHEYAHAWAASKLGDRTALQRGRLSFDPMRHLDPMGALCLVLFGFGWAKPVPVNPWYFKNRKTGMALTALAGPVSNLLMAFLGALLYNVLAMVLPVGNYWLAVYYFFYYYISINISLAVFNLLPIPPLDGSRIFAVVLPDRWNDTLARYERYIFPVMAVLLFSGILDGVLSVMNDWAFALVVGAASLPFQLFGL